MQYCLNQSLGTHLGAPYPLDTVVVDRLISEMDPELWTFIHSITRSISESKGYDVKTNDSTAHFCHLK